MEVAGPLGTPLGLAQWKRASPRGEAGTSGFLSVSDSDRRVSAQLGQESQDDKIMKKIAISLSLLLHCPKYCPIFPEGIKDIRRQDFCCLFF